MSQNEEEDSFGIDNRLEFDIEVEPVSLQARGTARAAFDAILADRLARFDFVIDSQVTLTAHWYGVPQVRWQTDRYPDLDNWMKPLLDAFVGADRLLVDDSLVRSIEVTWHEGYVDRSRIHLRLDFDPDHTLPKAGLRYAQFERGLCFPVPADVTSEAMSPWLDAAEATVTALAQFDAMDTHSISTWGLLSNGWVHRTRLGSSFTVVPVAELRKGG